MSISENKHSRGDSSIGTQRETRIDAAHSIVRTEAYADAREPAQCAIDGRVTEFDNESWDLGLPQDLPTEAVARHASELAERLQTRLAELDHREATLNRHEAEIDNRLRSARLWFEERERELDEREEQIEQRAANIDVQGDVGANSARAEVVEKTLVLEHRLQAVTKKEAEIELARAELVQQQSELEVQSALCQTKIDEAAAKIQSTEVRQRELDAREAEVYKLLEQSTNDQLSLKSRTVQLHAAECELTQRIDELKAWERKLAEQSGELEFLRAELNRHHQELEIKESDYAEQERRLKFREQEIKTALDRYQRLNVTEQRLAELQEQSELQELRSSNLDAAEALLLEQQSQLEERQAEVDRQYRAIEERLQRQRELDATERAEQRRKLEIVQQELARREAEVGLREKALDQMQDELRTCQREVLEIRLATEETWLQLQGVLAPAALSRSVSQIRLKLTDHFEVAASEAMAKRRELEEIRIEISAEYDKLGIERQDLKKWLLRCEQDLEQRAARLVARELELDRQEKVYEQAAREWQAQQVAYQRQLQTLLSDSRRKLGLAA